ncbi:hypothetical protein MLD38_008991 [Melastoma candidum]|uniref:Uncharacterized protein n=1 Tax=Melastoma candidum TaxID=119954 RepID=A0ACB9RW26_9MYRT|nr:hypothetical protein MLD38_008991 [Melastoma candidum]
MYIENVSELAFDDITPDDPDFIYIQGLAEAGLISSKLSRQDLVGPGDDAGTPYYFYPESPLSRQDLVSWKMALDKKPSLKPIERLSADFLALSMLRRSTLMHALQL